VSFRARLQLEGYVSATLTTLSSRTAVESKSNRRRKHHTKIRAGPFENVSDIHVKFPNYVAVSSVSCLWSGRGRNDCVRRRSDGQRSSLSLQLQHAAGGMVIIGRVMAG